MKLLHLEDNPADAELVRELLLTEWPDAEITLVGARTDYQAALGGRKFDLILSDFTLVNFNGLEALEIAKTLTPDVPFIFLSGSIGEDLAIEAVRSGAKDYVIKDRIKRLVTAIHRAVSENQERRQLRATEEARQRLAAVLESTPDFVSMASPDGHVLYLNHAGRQMLGLPDGPIPPDFSLADAYPPESARRLMKKSFPQAIRDGFYTGESTLRTHEGTQVPVSQVIIAHKSERGDVEYLSTILRDLTSRNQAEALINGQKQVLEMIAGGEPLTDIMTTLLSFIETQAPEMLCSLLLLEDDGKHLRSCAAPRLPADYLQAVDRIPIGPRGGSCGTAAFRRSAVFVADIATDLLWTDYRDLALAHDLRSCWATPVFDVNHRLLGTFAVYGRTPGDATERHRQLIDIAIHIAAICLSRHRAEQRLREQADILSKASNAIIITDLEDRVTFWNRGAERVYGWTSAEAVGRFAEDLFPPEDHPELNGALQASFDERDQSAEVRLHHKDGQPLIIEASATIIRDDMGQPKARLIVSSDLTAKRKLEEQFFRAQRLESVGMLAAGIAHDLNNVLAPILLAAPMLRENATVPGDLRMIDVLEKSAERGAALVRQILSFAHGADGAHQLIQVKHLLRDLANFIDQTFPKSIQLREFIPTDLWPIKGNATQIHQVLLNLCVNARDAMPQGGTLTLRAENSTVDEVAAQAIDGARAGSYLVLHVEDTGTGIPLNMLERIWEPFFTTKAAGKGTGLGLSTVRGIAENHGGFVTLRTVQNTGTTFRVYLPAAEVAIAKSLTADAPPPAPRGQGQLVLIVDDEPSIRKVATSMLVSHGYRVLSAADGSEAVSLFVPRSATIRVVITDLNMPNLDGSALAAVVHRLNPETKIVAISGLALNNSDTARMQPAADAFLQKPFKPEDLLNIVHDLLKNPVRSATL